MQKDHPDCPRVTQYALVLGSGIYVKPNLTVLAQSADSTIHSDSTQESVEPRSPCLAPRASAIKEQGFSEAVAPQRGSTRSVYEVKWTNVYKMCQNNQVDFRPPFIKSIADFLPERKLQPSTINGYRSTIADKLGSSPINVSKDRNLTCLLDNFHRDRPNGHRGIPSWNFSLVLHQHKGFL